MPDAAPASPPTRLKVASAAEAAKIRDYAAAWVAVERGVRRLQKTRRWKVARNRVNELNVAVAPHVLVCADIWLEWQLLRVLRAILDLLDPKVTGAGPGVLLPLRYWAAVLPHILLDEPGVQRFYVTLIAAAIMDAEEIETAFMLAAEPVAARARGQLAARGPKHGRHLTEQPFDVFACGMLHYQANLDASQLAALAASRFPDDWLKQWTDPALFREALSDAGLARRADDFRQRSATMTRVRCLGLEQAERRDRIFDEVTPQVTPPPAEWHDARLIAWLHQESLAQLRSDLSDFHGRVTRPIEPDVGQFLGGPLGWRLWLDDQWEAARLGSPVAEPQRTVVRQLVEAPGRFLRFPNPSPQVAEIRRVLRPLSDLLEGPPLATERAAMLAALGRDTLTPDELLQLLAVYCAARWRAGVSPKMHGRLVERWRKFLLEEIRPQGPDLLRDCAVEVGPALPTGFDAEFEKLVAAEEATQEEIAAELKRHADRWRDAVPAKVAVGAGRAAAVAAFGASRPQTGAVPIVLRYVVNLGEPCLREERIATTWDGLEQALEEFCLREGIRVTIPFSSVAHALEHYVHDTPPELKQVWPERETYGPLEFHKIKRGSMRLLVRESAEGLWLHLLQRKNWFLGEQ